MLFNSHTFIFGFLPMTFIGFYSIALLSRPWALRWLIFASLSFYAWWRPLNVLIIAPSILVNFALARLLLRLGADDTRRRLSLTVLIAGLAFNVAFLGVFKYTDFFRGAMNDVFGTSLVMTHIILPLGISFITFQKIAFLIDIQAGRVRSFTLQDYCLFVLFFPQLIAGPIVHFREMMPQFHVAPQRIDKEHLAVGVTLFFSGLFKKVFIADSLAPLVTPIYEQAVGSGGTSFLLAWMAAIGFTLQIYFDFSGYTDMALGCARLFGIRLPPNFNSPLKASSIIDFWLRWHMTLTRFLTAYIYNPLLLHLTRRRLAAGLPGFGGSHTTAGAFFHLLALPTLLTMFISGVWHGAGYLFILWGLLHGVFLIINHGWRLLVPRLWPDRARYVRAMTPLGTALTLICVATAMVLFRSSSIAAAADILKGMIGLHGLALPQPIYDHLGPLAGAAHALGVTATQGGGRSFLLLMMWIPILLLVVLTCPNTLQMLAPYEPALGVKRPPGDRPRAVALAWEASLPWALVVSVVAAVGVYSLGGQSEFLYWQF